MKILRILLLTMAFSGLFCSDYNPFENPANVKMVIMNQNNSIYSDSIAHIFSSETLFVAGSVREEIDSFSISVNLNRFFSDTTIVAPIDTGNYIFPFSFIDTGYALISLITYRKNGDDVNEEFEIYVSNPLSQDTVIIAESVVEELFTDPVKDSGVSYFWSFSPGFEELYTISQTSNSFKGNINDFNHNSNSGYLWAVDIAGNISPRKQFIYSFVDTTGPIISSDNDGYNPISKVIVTGDKTFRLKIRCNDLSGINTALINDENFDNYEMKYYNDYLFYKTFNSMDTLSDSMVIIVDALDKLNHTSRDTFYITYDASGPKEVFHLLAPSIQPYTTGSQNYDIQMEVLNLFNSSIYVIANHIEGGVTDTLDTIAISNSAEILRMSVNLAIGDNVIVFTALDSLGIELPVTDTVLISFSSTVIDDNPPQIIRTAINDIETEKAIISEDTAFFELSAYDDNLDSVIINGTNQLLNNNYKWYDTMVATSELTAFSIRLVDKSGNSTEKDIWVQKNVPPYISEAPIWPKTLVIGTPWKDTLIVADDDGDTVKLLHRVRKLNSDNSSLFNQILSNLVSFTRISRLRWEVSWNGTDIADTLKGKTIPTQIVLDDSKQLTLNNWDFAIVDSANAKAFDFTVTLPDHVDTTSKGAIDLSQILDTVVLNGKIESNSQTIGESDTITLIFDQQTVKYNSTNGIFDIVIDVGNKEIDNESIIITVSDTLGYVTIVDTLDIVYSKVLSDALYDAIQWSLYTEDSIETVFDPISSLYYVNRWYGEGITFKNNIYANGTPPILGYDSIKEESIISFKQLDKNSLYNTTILSNGPFTAFIVARLGANASYSHSYNLITMSGDYSYTGFGVVNGNFTLVGDSSVTIERSSETQRGPSVMDKGWHIFTISSSTGIVVSDEDDSINHFSANLWVDGYKVNCDTCVARNVPESYPYVILGGGAKHIISNGWEGDILNIINFEQALSSSQIVEISKYIASEFKININKYKKGVQIIRNNN